MEFELKSIVKVSEEPTYNAFTDMQFYEGYYWIAYRTGKAHVSPAGKIIIRRSKDLENWEFVDMLEKSGLDLRDPRLSVIRNKLYLLAFTLHHFEKGPIRFERGDSFFYILNSELKFDQVGIFNPEGIEGILWSLKYYKDRFYSTGYSFLDGNATLHLWSSKTLNNDWEHVAKIPDDQLPPNAGFNEADMIIEDDGNIILFCRVDVDSKGRLKLDEDRSDFKKGQEERKKQRKLKPHNKFGNLFAVAKSKYPFTEWEVKRHDIYLKGPRAIPYRDEFIGVFRYMKSQFSKSRRIEIFTYDEDFHPKLTLAKGRDGSYAGLLINPNDENELLISFYSDHEKRVNDKKYGKNNIWLARVKILND